MYFKAYKCENTPKYLESDLNLLCFMYIISDYNVYIYDHICVRMCVFCFFIEGNIHVHLMLFNFSQEEKCSHLTCLPLRQIACEAIIDLKIVKKKNVG